MTTILNTLEKHAQQIRQACNLHARPTPKALLERRIAIIAEQLDSARESHGQRLVDLIRAECYVGTDLLKLECYDPRVYAIRFKARDRLKQRLVQLGSEQRRLQAAHEQDIRQLQDQLTHAIEQRAQLDF